MRPLRSLYSADKNVDVVAIGDVAAADFSDALKGDSFSYYALCERTNQRNAGVGAIIHVASPNIGQFDTEGMISVCNPFDQR